MTEFRPRYPHPFSLEEATSFDASLITEEMARLRNSLTHLRATQNALQQYISESKDDVDLEVTKAYEENKDVIGAQEERIELLKMALRNKGVASTFHYVAQEAKETNNAEQGTANGDDDGIHL